MKGMMHFFSFHFSVNCIASHSSTNNQHHIKNRKTGMLMLIAAVVVILYPHGMLKPSGIERDGMDGGILFWWFALQ
jgi:hypothetical protein